MKHQQCQGKTNWDLSYNMQPIPPLMSVNEAQSRLAAASGTA